MDMQEFLDNLRPEHVVEHLENLPGDRRIDVASTNT